MENYQKRVVQEKTDLDERIEKLTDFISTQTYFDLKTRERNIMVLQLYYMRLYSSVLGERIAGF